jgi:hypothetical protein
MSNYSDNSSRPPFWRQDNRFPRRMAADEVFGTHSGFISGHTPVLNIVIPMFAKAAVAADFRLAAIRTSAARLLNLRSSLPDFGSYFS